MHSKSQKREEIQALLPIIVKQRLLGKILGCSIFIALAVGLAYIYPYEVVLNGEGFDFGLKASTLVLLVPICFVICIYYAGIGLIFNKLELNAEGVFRSGPLGTRKLMELSEVSEITREGSITKVFVRGQLKWRIPAPLWYLADED